MFASAYHSKTTRVALVLLIALVFSLALVGNAGAEGAPYVEVPGYPKYGCYDVAVAGIGMWGGSSPYWLMVDVPGPVVDAYMVWIGTEDVGAPDSPNQSDLIVNGTTVLGQLVDTAPYSPSAPPWYMWRADVGPSGANLVTTGMNHFDISGWELVGPSGQRRNGLSVIVVYDTGDCERPNQIDLIDNMDWYWERTTGEGLTDPMVFNFIPAPVDQEVTVWLHHAGTDVGSQGGLCRPEQIWVATGTGTPPDTIVQYGSPSVGLNGGQLGVTGGFWIDGCPTQIYWPVVSDILGWVDGFGWTTGTGGYISGQWSVIRLKIPLPAGATWLMLQGESVLTGNADILQTGESGAWFGQAINPLYNPELRVTKTDGVDTASPGDTLTYTIDYENYGYGTAENTVIVDTLPDYMTFVSATGGGVYDDATRTVTWNLGPLDKDVAGQFQVVVDLDPVFPIGTTTLTNQVTISTTTPGEQDLTDNADTDVTNVEAAVELSIDKVGAPEPVDAGSNLTYTIDWTVGGNAFAPGVTVVDTLPANVSFVSASDFGVYDPPSHTITWNLGTVTPVLSGSYTVEVAVDTPQYNGTPIENRVVIADTAGDTAEATAINTVRSDHELAVTKQADQEPVDAGSPLVYTINWEVTGNEPSPDATIVDTLPADVTFVNATGGGVYDAGTHTVTWSLGELMTPESGSFDVAVDVNTPLYNGTLLENTAVFSDSDPGTDAATATLLTTVRSDHELHISKLDDPDPVEKAAQLTYTIDWSVSGNEPADNVVIRDPMPFGTRFVSATEGGTYDPITNSVVWNLGNKVPGDSGTVSLVVVINFDFPNGLDIENFVTISDDKPGEEKEADARTTVKQTPEGSIGDSVWSDINRNGIQEPGEPGIAGVSLVLYDAGADGLCGTADDAPLANAVTDSNGVYRFIEVPAGNYCVDVVNTTLPAGLELTGGADPHGPIALAEGEQYRDADFGYGPVVGTGIIGDRVWSDVNGNGIQDPGEIGIGNVTLNLNNAGADGVCGSGDDTVAATTVTAPNGTYLFAGVLPGTYCVQVTDTGGVLVGMTLTGGTNPHGPITLAVDGTYLLADFGYQGTFTGRIGDLVFYDANRNGIYEPGPPERGIGDVTLDLLGPGADGILGTGDDIVLATASTDENGHYAFDGLPDGDYWVVVTDVNGRLPGYTQTYGIPDTDNHGQNSPYAVTIAGGNAVLTADFAYADGHLLTVTKTNDVLPGEPVEAGEDMVYTITYSASGREPALNVVLTDLLPMQVDFVDASDGGAYDVVTRRVTWFLGNLNPGDTGSVTLTVHVKKPLPNNSYIFNTVTIIDDANVRDEFTDVVRVHAEPILSLTKDNVPVGEVKPGDTIKYTLCFANTGNGNATNVVLVDQIPTYTTYVDGSATGGAVYDSGARTLTWYLGTVGPDVTGCGSFDVTVDMTIPGVTEVNQGWTVDNVANLDSTELPRVTASTSNALNATVKLTLDKQNDPAGEVIPGDSIKYTLCYANNGTANATGVVLVDQIPTYTTYVAGSATGAVVYDEAAGELTWNLGVVGPGTSACVSFEVTVNMTIEGLTGQATALSFAEWNSLAVDNVATLSSDQLPDKTASVSNPLNATVDPAIYKSVNASMFHVGETVVFTVTVTNRGTANATDLVVTDAIAPRLENVTVTSSMGTPSYDPATRVWTVDVGVLAPDETVTIIITGLTERVPPQDLPYQITNMATVDFQEGAPRDSNEVVIDVVYLFPGEVPEPSTWLLLGSGLAGLAGYAQMRVRARRRKKD